MKLSGEELHAVRVAAGRRMRAVQSAKLRRLEANAERAEREYYERQRKAAQRKPTQDYIIVDFSEELEEL